MFDVPVRTSSKRKGDTLEDEEDQIYDQVKELRESLWPGASFSSE